MERIIFHIDVNSAFLSWTAVEQLKNGAEIDIREIPAIIGGDQKSRRGVVLAKSIPAKKYGIKTGEPAANALRKCPGLRMESPNHKLYHQYSEALMHFLHTYTPDIEQVSVDECYLDFAGIAHLYPSAMEAAFEIKDRVHELFGFTVNIGISNNKLLAKMASDFQKPNRVHTLFLEEIEEKMWPLPVSELYMAGKSSVETLKKLEIYTIGDLAQADPKLLELHMKSHGKLLWEFANGIESSEVQPEEAAAKGIGNSTTLPNDVETLEEAKKVLLALSESVGRRLRKAGQKANMVSVEIKYNTFQKVSHQKQLVRASQADTIIYQAACELFEELWDKEPLRLLGIRTSKLVEEEEPEQMTIFDLAPAQREEQEGTISDEKHRKLNEAMDQIRKKYGNEAVVRGTILNTEREND